MEKGQIADVLEEAARLYKDEKVQWCQGAWVEITGVEGWSDDTRLDSPGLPLNACAEGALMKAAGFTWNQVYEYDMSGDRDLLLDNPEGRLFKAALAVMAGVLRAELGRRLINIPKWNDELVREGAKEKVIDTMETAAKDLRNA